MKEVCARNRILAHEVVVTGFGAGGVWFFVGYGGAE